MIQSGLLGEEDREALIALARDDSAACRVTRRANALVLLDDGGNCRQVAHALLLDDDTIRGWRKLFEQRRRPDQLRCGRSDRGKRSRRGERQLSDR